MSDTSSKHLCVKYYAEKCALKQIIHSVITKLNVTNIYR